MAYRMGEFGRTIRALNGPNRRMIDRNMLVISPLQMHAHTGSHEDDKKCAHVTSQEPPHRNQRIPHPECTGPSGGVSLRVWSLLVTSGGLF